MDTTSNALACEWPGLLVTVSVVSVAVTVAVFVADAMVAIAVHDH